MSNGHDLSGRACGIKAARPYYRAFALSALAMFLLPGACHAGQGNDIRVLLFDDVPSVNVSVAGGYRIVDSAQGSDVYAAEDLKARFAGSRSAILFSGKSAAARAILILSEAGRPIAVNNKNYKGAVQLVRKSSGRLSVINCLDLEDYVKGIAVRETSHYWPMEALKAQAVVFRTFALYRAGQSRAKDYDVTADVFSQGYGGKAAERYRISDAVDQTRGQVLYYNGTILPAFYHAACGGHTEDASELWDIRILPLKGVACGFCKESPHFFWKAVIAKEKIRKAWNKEHPDIPQVNGVAVRGKTASARAASVVIMTADRELTISAKDFRHLMGEDVIRSTDFKARPLDGNIVFEGRGWGHGAGLCQWGAYFMAKQGRQYRDILSWYYPSAVLTTVQR